MNYICGLDQSTVLIYWSNATEIIAAFYPVFSTACNLNVVGRNRSALISVKNV